MLSRTEAQRNERLNALDILLSSPFSVITLQYTGVLVTRLGAPPLLLGMLTGGSALIAALMALLGPRWMERVPSYRTAMAGPALIARLVMFVIPVALLLPGFQAEFIVIASVLLGIPAGLSNFTMTASFPRMTLPNRLAQLIGLRWTWLGIGMTLATPAVGWLLESLAMPVNYLVACSIGYITVMASLASMWLVKLGPRTGQPSARKSISLTELRGNPVAVRFLWVALLTNLAVFSGGPLMTLRLVRGLNANDAEVGLYFAANYVMIALAGLVADPIIARIGKRNAIALGTVLSAGHVLAMALAPSFSYTFLSALAMGFSGVLFQVSVYALMVEVAPEGKYEGFSGLNTMVLNLATFVAPLVMTSLVTAGISVVAALLVSTALRIVSAGVAMRVLPRH